MEIDGKVGRVDCDPIGGSLLVNSIREISVKWLRQCHDQRHKAIPLETNIETTLFLVVGVGTKHRA